MAGGLGFRARCTTPPCPGCARRGDQPARRLGATLALTAPTLTLTTTAITPTSIAATALAATVPSTLCAALPATARATAALATRAGRLSENLI